MKRLMGISLLFFALLAGCSKATQDNYNKIESGMSHEEVYSILGKPDEVNSGSIGSLTASSETWQGKDHTISVKFANDEVKMKSITANEDEEK